MPADAVLKPTPVCTHIACSCILSRLNTAEVAVAHLRSELSKVRVLFCEEVCQRQSTESHHPACMKVVKILERPK